MKTSTTLGVALFVAGMIVALLQLWFIPWAPETFIKIELTLGAILLVVLVVGFVLREYREDSETRSGRRLD